MNGPGSSGHSFVERPWNTDRVTGPKEGDGAMGWRGKPPEWKSRVAPRREEPRTPPRHDAAVVETVDARVLHRGPVVGCPCRRFPECPQPAKADCPMASAILPSVPQRSAPGESTTVCLESLRARSAADCTCAASCAACCGRCPVDQPPWSARGRSLQTHAE